MNCDADDPFRDDDWRPWSATVYISAEAIERAGKKARLESLLMEILER